jgi:nitroreductase
MPIVPAGEPARQLAALLRARPSLALIPEQVADAATRAWPGQGTCSAFPWPAWQLAGILSARRSVRTFSKEPLAQDQVTQIVATARAACGHVLPVPSGLPNLEILVAACAVGELPPGVYRWPPDGGPDRVAGHELVTWLAEQYVAAPAILLVCGQLCESGSPSPAAYGATLTRAGALGYATLLAAVSVGLAGCPFGGSSPSANQVAKGAAAGASHLFTIAIGKRHDGARAGAKIASGGCR